MDMKVELKNLSLIICPILLVLCMVLPAEALIDLDSRDTGDPTDNDEVYHAGQLIEIIATDSEGQAGLRSAILITSKTTGYNFGPESLVDEDDGSYTFSWDTTNLKEASDYIVKVDLGLSEATLMITIDNTSPTDPRIVINNGEPFTVNPSARLNLYSEGASEMYISGDVVDDANSFEWISYAESIQVRLTGEYKAKSVKVQFRDKARNLSETATATITFERALISSHDADFPSDDDGVYHAGQAVQLAVAVAQGATSLDGTIQIKSPSMEYDSGVQKLNDIGGGSYSYLWDTTGLPEASDYKVSAILTNPTGVTINPRPLIITLDNDPPTDVKISINNGEPITSRLSVSLTLSAKGAVEMFIEGDVVDDTNTFEWIPYSESLLVNLTAKDGEKRVVAIFRNLARIESEPVEASIILDSEPPVIVLIESQDATNPEDNDNYYHAGQSIIFRFTTEGNESGLSGNILIKSKKVKYNSGRQKLTDEGDGSYSYLWDTTGLKESRDYIVEATLIDQLKREVGLTKVTTNPITLIIDNTPPTGKIILNNNARRTISRSVTLKTLTSNAVEIYISGDIVDDTNTFEWIPYVGEIVLNLTDGTGEKVVSAKLKDKAGNENEEIKATIIFSATSPKISRVDSWDESDTSDNDEYYHAGQKIKIAIWSDKDTAWFLGNFRIKSSVNNYDSGNLKAIDEGDGRYTYLWDTTDLADGEYAVEAVLSDGVAKKAFNRSLVITIDNTSPDIPSVEIDAPKAQTSGGKIRTASASVGLSFSGNAGVKELYIDGDAIDDTNTFEWIPFVEKLTINLTAEDGEKQFSIKYRDAALNESETAVKTIVLDTTGPSGSIIINEGAEYTTDSLVSIKIESLDAAEMYLSGDIAEENNFQWVPYAPSITAHLTEDDGAKTVKVSFRDDLGNIGAEFEDTITLDTSPPKIKAVTSQNIANSEDNDGRYRIGDTIKITPEVEGEEPDLKGSLRITSETTGYDSGSQRLTAEGENGILSFLWETNRFHAAEDYKVEIRLQDAAGNETVDSSLILALVSASAQESVTINNGDEYTELASVELKIFSDNAVEMLIEGDVKDDSNTFEWIDYASSLEVKLTQGDGEKTVKVTFRDALQRESGPVEDTITLDTAAPKILAVKSHDAADEMDNDGKYHAGETVKFIVETAAAETGLKGSIRIHSSKVSYDSGVQKLQDDGAGEYSYLWETTGLKESDDYVVEAILTDLASHQTTDDALAITIDNTPPQNVEFGIQNSELQKEASSSPIETKTRSLKLTISAEDSVQMWIEGDVVDDTNTFEWIPYSTELVVNLTPGDGEKTIKVRHKDTADNESLTEIRVAEASAFKRGEEATHNFLRVNPEKI